MQLQDILKDFANKLGNGSKIRQRSDRGHTHVVHPSAGRYTIYARKPNSPLRSLCTYADGDIGYQFVSDGDAVHVANSPTDISPNSARNIATSKKLVAGNAIAGTYDYQIDAGLHWDCYLAQFVRVDHAFVKSCSHQNHSFTPVGGRD